MARPRSERSKYAHDQADELRKRWLNYDETDMKKWYREASHRDAYNNSYVKSGDPADDGGNGTTQQQCMDRDWKGVTVQSKLDEFKTNRRKCLYNMIPNWGEQTDFDHSLHLAYDWNWRAATLETPPDGILPLTFSLTRQWN